MRLSLATIIASSLCLMVFAGTASAQDAKKGKGKKTEPEKMELKDLPPTVAEAAKRDMPSVKFTTVQKHSLKKLGMVYTLEGKDGKYQVAVTYNSSGEIQRFTKNIEGRKKKAG